MVVEWIGSRLGRYHVEGLIGQGAMGVVVRAHDPDLARTVAIKILYPHLVADKDLVERFRREARTGANLHHRSIVAIHDVGQEGDRYYLVMEFLAGKPLSKIIDEQGALPPEQVLAVSEQIASALDYIHRQKLVHRDVKASNILLDPDGRAVLTDFGLARSVAGSDLTASGTIVGSPHYIAPEQVSGGEVGPWTDLYALGVVVYEALSGQFPFEADPLTALFFQVLWETPPPINLPAAAHPEVLDQVVQRALAKDPPDRYPSGAALVDGLRYALLEKGGPATVAEPARPVRQPAKKRPAGLLPRWLLGVMGSAVLLLLMGAVFLTGAVPLPGSPSTTATVSHGALGTTQPSLSVPTSPPAVTEVTPNPPTPAATTLLIAPTATVSLTLTPRSTLTPTLTPSPTPTATRVPTRRPRSPTPTPVPTSVPTPIPPPPTATPIPPPTAKPPPDTRIPPTVPTITPTWTPSITPPPTVTPPPPATPTQPPPPTVTPPGGT